MIILAIDPGERPGYALVTTGTGSANCFFRVPLTVLATGRGLLDLPDDLLARVTHVACETQWLDPSGKRNASILQLARTAGMQAMKAAIHVAVRASAPPQIVWLSPDDWRNALVRSRGVTKEVAQARIRRSLPVQCAELPGDTLDAIGIAHGALAGKGKSRPLPP